MSTQSSNSPSFTHIAMWGPDVDEDFVMAGAIQTLRQVIVLTSLWSGNWYECGTCPWVRNSYQHLLLQTPLPSGTCTPDRWLVLGLGLVRVPHHKAETWHNDYHLTVTEFLSTVPITLHCQRRAGISLLDTLPDPHDSPYTPAICSNVTNTSCREC